MSKNPSGLTAELISDNSAGLKNEYLKESEKSFYSSESSAELKIESDGNPISEESNFKFDDLRAKFNQTNGNPLPLGSISRRGLSKINQRAQR